MTITTKKARAELGQAQVKLEIIDKVEVEIVVEVGIQLLTQVMAGGC